AATASGAWYTLMRHPIALAVAIAVVVLLAIAIFGLSAWSIAIPLVVITALLSWGIAYPQSSLLYPTVSHGGTDARRVALSFDDGPDADVTPRVLDILADAGAQATFFAIGQKLAAQPELARRILAEGHEL